MSEPRAITLLPVDKATVVVPLPEPPNLVMKHTDGELIRLVAGEQQDGSPRFLVDRRDEDDVSWWGGTTYEYLDVAVSAAADRQAFGVKSGGAPTNMFDISAREERKEVLELEPMHLGGILLDDTRHLPIVLHLRDHSYWRLRERDERGEKDDVPSFEEDDRYIIEKSEDQDDWEVFEEYHAELTIRDLIQELADYTGVEWSDPHSDAMEGVLSEYPFYWLEDAVFESEGEVDIRPESHGVQGASVQFQEREEDDGDDGDDGE